MNCDLKNREETIARYLLGELSEKEAIAFEEHYFQCDICFNELKAAEEAVNLIEQEGNEILSLGKSENQLVKKNSNQNIFKIVFSKPLGIAVSLVVVVLIILFFILPIEQNRERKQPNLVASNRDSLSKKIAIENSDSSAKNPKKISANAIASDFSSKEFKANPYIEEWMVENVRAENDKFDKMISPGVGQKFYGKEILFSWKMIKDEPITFTILTNQEKRVFRTNLSTENFPTLTLKVPPKTFKQSGLYYFRIEDADEVLYLGKFYFIK